MDSSHGRLALLLLALLSVPSVAADDGSHCLFQRTRCMVKAEIYYAKGDMEAMQSWRAECEEDFSSCLADASLGQCDGSHVRGCRSERRDCRMTAPEWQLAFCEEDFSACLRSKGCPP